MYIGARNECEIIKIISIKMIKTNKYTIKTNRLPITPSSHASKTRNKWINDKILAN